MHESVGSGGIHYAGKVCLYERVKYSMNLRVLCHGSTELGWIDICMITISHQLGSAKLIVTGASSQSHSDSVRESGPWNRVILMSLSPEWKG